MQPMAIAHVPDFTGGRRACTASGLRTATQGLGRVGRRLPIPVGSRDRATPVPEAARRRAAMRKFAFAMFILHAIASAFAAGVLIYAADADGPAWRVPH